MSPDNYTEMFPDDEQLNLPIFKMLFPDTATTEDNMVQLMKILTHKVASQKDEIERLKQREVELRGLIHAANHE